MAMGMFDEIKCECELPDSISNDTIFQTKSLECLLERYTITSDGRLIHHQVRYETVSEEERPYYGKPEWEKSDFTHLIGSVKSVAVGDVEAPFHGDLVFYTSIGSREAGDYEWLEYKARFTDGKLQWIRRN